MKINNRNRKGFTLIELLAVIVVLAIVMVLATSTILPLLSSARTSSFALEANNAIDAASQAVSLIQLGTSTIDTTESGDYKRTVTDTSTTYCFSLKKLIQYGLLKKDEKSLGATKYEGTVTVTAPKNSNQYTYAVSMHSSNFYVNSTGNVEESNVNEWSSSSTVTLKTSCS